jgi:hypothetical protein
MSRTLSHIRRDHVNQESSRQGSSISPNCGRSTGSLEWKLLLAATAIGTAESKLPVSSLNPNQAQAIDWPALLSCANFHGTSSLLYKNLSGAAPAQAIGTLRARYVENVQRSLFLARELTRILDCLHGRGIEVISYKGIVLSEIYYGDMAMRPAGDIDLFVRKPDVIRARGALRELNYMPSQEVPENSEADYIASGYEYSFDSPAGKHLLEVQWALQPRYYAVDYDMDALFARAVEVSVGDRIVKTPSPEDLLLVLCMHAAKHVWGRLIWLCDIAQILQRNHLDLASVQSRARELGIVRILHVTLSLANRFLKIPIPAAIEPGLRADRAAQALAEEVTPSIIAGISWEEHKLAYFRLMVRLRERRTDQLRFLSRLTFTPGPGEWQAVKLPRVLSPLYRAIRMARLAARFSR